MPLPLVNRATNTVEQVDEAKAQEALRSGKYALKKGQQVPVVNGAGQIGTLDAAGLGSAGTDIRFALPSELAQDAEQRAAVQRAKDYGADLSLRGWARDKVATFEGAARGLTMGASDWMAINTAKAFGGEEAEHDVREHLAGYKDANPIGAIGGEVGGALAPLILSGGGMAAGAVRGVGALPRATAAIGEATEAGVAGLMGEGASALGRIGRKAVARGVSGAFEGGAYGLGSQVSEDALGDTETTAAKALAAIGHGAFLGGVAGGLLGGTGGALGEARDGAGRFLSQLRARDVDSLAEKTFGQAAPGIGELFVKGSALATGQDESVIRKLLQRRSELADIGEVRAQSSREVRSYLDQMLESNRELTDEAKGVLKAEYVRKAVRRGNELEAGDTVVGWLNDLRSQMKEMLDAPKQYGEKRVLSNAIEYVDDVARRADDAMVGGTDANAKLFMLGDETKRAIGRWTKGLQAVERQADPLRLMRGRATRDRFQDLYESLRKGLEDEGVWGKAAGDQAAINASWTKQIDAHRVFDARLTTNVGRDPKNPWADIRRVDPAKADAYVAGLTNPNNDLVHSAIRNYVDATKSLAETVGRAYELPPEKALHVERVARTAQDFGKTLGRAEDALTLGNQFAALKAAETGTGIGEASAVLGALGHPIVGALGQAIGAVSRPATTIARLTALERLVGKTNGRIGQAVKGFFRRADDAGARRLGARARVSTPATVDLFEGRTRDERRASFDREVERIQTLSSNPDLMTAGATQSLAGINAAAPKVSSAMTVAAAKGMQFLASKVPVGLLDTKSITPQLEKPLVSDAEMSRFARYVSAVEKPESVLHDLERGIVTPEQVEALRVTHGPIYEELRNKIVDELVTQKSPLPYNKRVELGVLFGVPTDATLDPGFLQAIQNAQGAAPAEPMAAPLARAGPPSRPLKLGNSMQTEFQAVMQGDEK